MSNTDNEVNNVDQIPQEQKGAFHSFLKSLASFSGDLSSLTCPAFLLAPVSLIEYSEYWTQQPDLFTDIAKSDDEVERMVAFVKWFISSLNASYSRRVPKGEWEKKPYNPVLGEQFKMTWGDLNGTGNTDVLVEQVSHHPPVTGFYIKNDKAGISLNGHTGQKTRFSSTSLIVDQVGQSLVTLKNRDNEQYLFSYPSITVNGIWYAAPYIELLGTSYIQSSTGLYCSIEYTSRGWISGTRNYFKCYIRRNSGGNSKEYLYKIEGQWSGKSTITKYGSKTAEPFLDVTELTPAPMHVKEIEEQDEMESRRIWQKVSEAIRANDTNLAGVEKAKIENQKREEKAARQAAGTEWEPHYFHWVPEEPTVSALQRMLTSTVKNKYTPATNGNWVYKQ
ncbi:Protein KES1 [Choanephora cucurbitarum]|uniref:Protein KES1 n=1 Tax=Choanephora cucurbitarum TaxID=101091 RepID=A0A1C7NM88_9FUNG|nr:Protein KES1 [Choanephora cucurbitarum]